MTDMTREDAEQMVWFLCWRAGVKRPSVIAWTNRVVRGRYQYPSKKHPRGRLVIGQKAWRGPVDCLIHEVAHHVAAMRAPKLSPREKAMKVALGRRRGGGGREHHGPAFSLALEDVVRAWGSYTWATEYPTVRERHHRLASI
jgi:hypothetical protein